MQELINKYFLLKDQIKSKRKDLEAEYEKDSDYCNMKEDLKADREVLRSHRDKLTLGEAMRLKSSIDLAREELKQIKDEIKSGVMTVKKDTGEQLTLPF